ncbi:MAG: hypothetical protein MI743_09910 [Sneathiellales bacterium]|nr:hypothetical protein [Sneathiellales bacterium]
MKYLISAVLAVFFSVNMITISHAAILTVAGGILTGAKDVDVGGTLYNVEFIDDTCSNIYSGCDEISDLDFADEASATLAAQALLSQVFIDSLFGNFDSQPELINGCDDATGCNFNVTYGFNLFNDVRSISAFNNDGSNTDSTGFGETGINYDVGQVEWLAYARFTPAISAIPLPAALPLYGAGILILGIWSRRKKIRQA